MGLFVNLLGLIIEFVGLFVEFNIAAVLWVLVFCFSFWMRSMWDLCSLTRDQTHSPSIGR